MKPVNITCVSFYSKLWFLWSTQTSDCCDTTIKMLRDERQVGMGHSFTLTCEFICVRPSYVLQWCRGAHSLFNISTNQSNFILPLHVTHAGPNDSGEYYCQTQPPVAASNTVFIKVLDLFVNVSRTVVEVLEGETAELSCTVMSALKATIFWARGGCEENGILSTQETLVLAPAAIPDSGEYHCCSSIPTAHILRRSKMVQLTVLRPESMLQCQLLWYLMCKAGIFLLFIATVVIFTCTGHC